MFIFKAPPKLVRSSRPIISIKESLGTTTDFVPQNKDANALVLDARKAINISDLTWLYKAAQRHSESAAFRKPGGRIVVLRTAATAAKDPESAAVSEAIVGFAKSLAKENGPRGATVNLLCDNSSQDRTKGNDACEAPLQWVLSHGSCYVTGQELIVEREPSPPKDNGAFLITGAAGAIGKATAEYLYTNNMENSVSSSRRMILVDHPSTEKTLDEIATKMSDDVDILPLDLTQSDASDILIKEGIKSGGWERIVHAAGITRDKTLRNMEYDTSWWPVLQINLEAAIKIDKTLLNAPDSLLKNGGSSFVYFSSTSGIAGNAGQSNYAASKSGLLGYAVAMGHRYPEHFFRVVSPGFIATDMTAKMPFLVRMVATRLNALGQAGKPEDIAEAVAFLSSSDASGLAPGMNLRVCGMFMGGR